MMNTGVIGAIELKRIVAAGEGFALVYSIRIKVTGEYVDLTGYTWKGQMRRSATASGAPSATFRFQIIDHPTTGEPGKAVKIFLTGDDTKNLKPQASGYPFVVSTTPPGGEPMRIIKGLIIIDPAI